MIVSTKHNGGPPNKTFVIIHLMVDDDKSEGKSHLLGIIKGVWRSGLVRWCSDQGGTGSNPTAVSMSLCPWARHFTPNCSCGDCPQY